MKKSLLTLFVFTLGFSPLIHASAQADESVNCYVAKENLKTYEQEWHKMEVNERRGDSIAERHELRHGSLLFTVVVNYTPTFGGLAERSIISIQKIVDGVSGVAQKQGLRILTEYLDPVLESSSKPRLNLEFNDYAYQVYCGDE